MVKRRSFAFLLAASLLPTLLSAQSLEPDEYHYTYDAANNLTSRRTVTGGMETAETLPMDSSGRNRPASLGGVPLAWDANGNLIQKGDLRLAYDYRNQLREVRDPLGETIASYAYDALGRRVRQTIGSEITEIVWKDWQPIETYVNGILASRRTYGTSIDEIVYLEQDVDLDGTLETRLHPIYDSSGNLAVVTGENGKPVERYSYGPYGRRRIYVDSTPPRIDQILTTDTGIWIEFSEMVNASAIEAGITAGNIRLEDADPNTAYTLTAEPLHLHAKRHRLTLVPNPLPSPGTNLTLTFEPETLTDYFLNRPTAAESFTFSWPADYAVAYDGAPPVVTEVRYSGPALEVEFSQIINPDVAAFSIQLDGMVTTWAVSSENTYRLVSQQPVPSGTYDFLITTDLANISGRPLAQAFAMQLSVDVEIAPQIAYREPDSRETGTSAVANTFGFHGLPRDPLTGFVYMRNRYYDPEMGRFITADPMGYVDGPSMYAAFGNDPINKRDPLGLYQTDFHQGITEYMARAAGFSNLHARILGLSAQKPDEDDRDPLVTGKRLKLGALYQKSTEDAAALSIREWHFPLVCSGGVENPSNCRVIPNSPIARSKIERGISTGSLKNLGEGLHVLQDSFSHQGIPAWHYHNEDSKVFAGYGHPETRGGGLSTSADLPDKYPADAMQAADATFNAMLEWRVQNSGLSPAEAERLRVEYMTKTRSLVEAWTKLDSREKREAWLAERGIVLNDH